MTTRQLRVTLESPGLFGGLRGAGNVVRSLTYIPGSTLRGAFAWRYLNGGGSPDDAFFKWAFVSGHVRWPFLYYATGEDADQVPLTPASARECKTDKEHCADELWEEDMARGGNCPVCEEKLGSAMRKAKPEPGSAMRKAKPEADKVETRWITRTAIEQRTRAAAQSLLHTVVPLAERQVFAGTLRFDPSEEHEETLTTFLAAIEGDPPALGGGRTRGFGSVKVESSASGTTGALADRLAAFNAGRRGETRFSLTVVSPVLLTDSLWRPCRVITPQHLAEAAGTDGMPGDLREPRSWSHVGVVGGWNEKGGLPREQALAIERGSVFLFKTALPVAEIAPWLERLEQAGLGDRRAEGYGEIAVCHEAHFVYRSTVIGTVDLG